MLHYLLVLFLSSVLGWCLIGFAVCAVAFVISLFQTKDNS